MIQLRDYQQECLVAIDQALADAEAAGRLPRTLVIAATGTGKTVIFLAWLDKLPTDARVLIIAHRRELIYQPRDRAAEFCPAVAERMGVVMGQEDDVGAQVIVATVQSLTSGDRMARILAHGPIDVCILDEAHHGTASTYLRVLDELGPECRVIGFTATPMRTDGDGLRKVFGSCAYRFSIDAAIRAGALVPFDALGFSLPLTLESVRETEDGWERESLGDLLKAENIQEIVHEKWCETGGNERPSIGFTASVAQAHAAAAHFRARGVAAEALDGGTPTAERDAILRRFQAGETRIVWNCQVLTEGFDAPEASCVLMVCPTKSDLAYVQKMGRGLRTAKNKTNCLVLDFAPMAERNVIMAGDVLGKPRDLAKAEKRAEDSGILISALSLDQFGMVSSVDPTEVVVAWLDYMRRGTSLAWSLEDNVATASLSESAMIAVVLPDIERIAKGEALKRAGDWNTRREALLDMLKGTRVVLMTKDEYRWQSRTLGHFTDEEAAKSAASEAASRLLDPRLGKRSRGWRRKPASEAQLRALRRMGVPVTGQPDRGMASQLIAGAMARRLAEEHLAREEATI